MDEKNVIILIVKEMRRRERESLEEDVLSTHYLAIPVPSSHHLSYSC
jgi:hypothetical protein